MSILTAVAVFVDGLELMHTPPGDIISVVLQA